MEQSTTSASEKFTNGFETIILDQVNPSLYIYQEESDSLGFPNKIIRLGFLRKIYGILTLQLVLTLGGVAILTFQAGVKIVVNDHILYILLIPFGFVALLVIVVFIKKNQWKHFPLNYFVLMLITILITLSVSAIASYFEVYFVLAPGGTMIFVVFATFWFTLQSRWAISFYCGLILMLLEATFMAIIMYFGLPDKEVTVYKILTTILISFLLSIYAAIVILGTMKGWIGASSPEEYMQTLISIYSGAIILFIIVLCIFALVANDGSGCGSTCTGFYLEPCDSNSQ